MRDIKEFIGKTITKVDFDGDIKFTLDDGSIITGSCAADCCSNTWIEDLINPEMAVGTVLRANNLELPNQFCGPTRTDNYEEVMAYYGFFIETAAGRCVIAYRNSSNGYYGGWINWTVKEFEK